jgi:Tol biopolymer transport system component
VAVAVAAWLFRGTAREPAAAPEVVPLTSYAGIEQSPSFSPDGNQVAFSWSGEKQDNFDIYVKLIGYPTPQRLTTDPADDVSPAFSPDGRSIGFVRVSKEHASFIVIPAIGGPERVVAEVTLPANFVGGRLFAWFPDGKWIVTDGLALLSTETGETRRLTSPPKSPTDHSPAVSPDGHTVAFIRSAFWSGSDIYLLDLTEDLKPKGEPRRLTSLKSGIWGSAWTPDGREIIVSSGDLFHASLWRVPASSSAEPEQLPFTGEAYLPAISRIGNRLAYAKQSTPDSNIWRLSLSGPGVASGSPARFITSTRTDTAPQYSPDGQRIAFESDRSGVYGIWVCDADGANAVELFSRAGASAGTARWSPDGQRVAFDFTPGRNSDIYVIRAAGGMPIPVTNDPKADWAPSWSKDGHWIYFASMRTGRWETWKVSAGGGEAVQVTRNGGETAFESPDGKSIYYTKGFWGSTGLWNMPLSGGEESQVLPSVVNRSFFPGNDGIYFIPGPGADGKHAIQFLSYATGRVRTVAAMSGPPQEGLSVSPDGRSLLFSQLDESGSDLMLVENFH